MCDAVEEMVLGSGGNLGGHGKSGGSSGMGGGGRGGHFGRLCDCGEIGRRAVEYVACIGGMMRGRECVIEQTEQ